MIFVLILLYFSELNILYMYISATNLPQQNNRRRDKMFQKGSRVVCHGDIIGTIINVNDDGTFGVALECLWWSEDAEAAKHDLLALGYVEDFARPKVITDHVSKKVHIFDCVYVHNNMTRGSISLLPTQIPTQMELVKWAFETLLTMKRMVVGGDHHLDEQKRVVVSLKSRHRPTYRLNARAILSSVPRIGDIVYFTDNKHWFLASDYPGLDDFLQFLKTEDTEIKLSDWAKEWLERDNLLMVYCEKMKRF